MKQTHIVAAATLNLEHVQALDRRAEFRKATQNMKMASAVLHEALAPLLESVPNLSSHLGLILATGHGEFNSTIEFLKEWAVHKHARPFVFQSSLHNSTTGFLSLYEKITAPTFTLSHNYFSGEEALDMAMQLLKGALCPVVAVVGIDTRIHENLSFLKGEGFPHRGWGQGAGAVVLASETFSHEYQLPTFGMLHPPHIDYCQTQTFHYVRDQFATHDFYDSQAIECLAQAVLKKDSSLIDMAKPNGGKSQIHWTKND